MAVFIGTSGFGYNHWVGKFYPEELPKDKWLSFYAQHFSSVEINYSFYHIPRETTLEKWYDEAPEGFVYTLKGSRLITHRSDRKQAQFMLIKFLKLSHILGEKMGVILLQFPPYMKDIDFIRSLADIPYPEERVAFELRNELLFTDEVMDILREKNIAFVFASSTKFEPLFVRTADFVYFRFHGNRRLYASSYSDGELEYFAEKIKEYLSLGLDVYAYFNNDARGFAVDNALTLKRLVSQ